MSQFSPRMWRSLGMGSLCLTILLLLAACQPMLLQPESEGAVSTPAAAETPEPAEEETPEGSDMESSTNGEGALSDVEQGLVDRAIADLVQETSLTEEEITLASIQAMEWSDASLGCPQEGMMYAQVITPGYLITLEAAGESYEYHAGDREGSPVMRCDDES